MRNLGYEILFIDPCGNTYHAKYCLECCEELSEICRENVIDDIDETFICDGCRQDIAGEDL
jgi:uncharacterized protein with PIN domain